MRLTNNSELCTVREPRAACLRRTLLPLGAMVAFLPAASTVCPGGQIVVPPGLAAAEANGRDTSPLGIDGEVRFQQVYGAALLGGLPVGSVITGLTFRVDGDEGSDVPAQTVLNYEVRLSQSANAPGSLGLTFADNRGADEVVVRSGPLTINAGDFPATGGSGPEPFGADIAFTTPYTYLGGDLLLEVAYTGFSEGRITDQVNDIEPNGQQIFGPTGAGGFSATTAVLNEPNDAFVARFTFQPAAVPEPSTLALGALGGLGSLGYGWRRRKRGYATWHRARDACAAQTNVA